MHSRARDPDQHSAGGQAGVLVNVKPLQSRIACNDMVDLLYVHRADQDSPKSQLPVVHSSDLQLVVELDFDIRSLCQFSSPGVPRS